MQSPEDYRKNPIWKTDFSDPVSVILTEMRNKLTKLRGTIHDINWGYPDLKDRINYIEGYLTTGLIALHSTIAEIKENEIKQDDHKFGKSIHINSRGIGMDSCPGCFVCGGGDTLMSNISGFVSSKYDGEEIASWFKSGAYLDFRPSEPNWIQVKIGSCKNHYEELIKLDELISVHDVLRKSMIESVISQSTL